MKKYTLLLLCMPLLLLAGNDAYLTRAALLKQYTQSLNNKPGEKQKAEVFRHFVNSGLGAANKTDAVMQRIIGYRYDEYVDGSWGIIDSLRMTYSGNRGGTYIYNDEFDTWNKLQGGSMGAENVEQRTNTRDADGNITQLLVETWSGTAFVNYNKTLNTWDAAGHLLSRTQMGWDGTNWVNDSKTEYTYDAAGNELTITTYGWSSGAWTESNRTLNTYDTGNRLLTNTYQSWVSGAWQDQYKYTYTYTTNGYTATEVKEENTGSGLENSAKYTYTYDASNDNTIYLEEQWNSGAWQNKTRLTYTYTNHVRTSVISESWDGTNWLNVSKNTYTLNGAGYVTEETEYNWTSGAWVESYRFTYTYNASNQETEYLMQAWNGSLWLNLDHELYTYDANGNPDLYTEQSWGGNSWNTDSQTDYDYNSYGNLDYVLYQIGSEAGLEDSERNYFYYETYNGPSSIAELADGLKVLIYPNPTADVLNIDYRATVVGSVLFTIYNTNGQQIAALQTTTSIGDNYLPFNVAALSAGVYFMEVKQNAVVSRLRFVKQ